MREVQQVLRQKYLQLGEKEHFESLLKIELVLRDIARREGLVLDVQQKQAMRAALRKLSVYNNKWGPIYRWPKRKPKTTQIIK